MFVDISLRDYNMRWELQHSYFLKDCLYEEISYELKESKVIIYKKLDNGISEEITLDELIFYIHTDVALYMEEQQAEGSNSRGSGLGERYSSYTAWGQFHQLFNKIDNIKKAVENMKIILKYDNDSESKDAEESDGEGGEEESKGDDVSEADGTNEDNETLAF